MPPKKRVRIPLPKGFVAPGFEDVLKTFKDSFSKGIDKGASFSAFYRGEAVVNIWGGLADEEVKRPWKEDTMGFWHSTTKFAGAVTMAHLVDRKLIKYNQKISSIWPEFAQNGKSEITLEMLLSVRSGLAALSDNFHLSWLRDDPQRLSEVLAKQRPLWPPDTAHGYHPQTMGLYLDQVVRRVDPQARGLAQYWWDEIAQPFDLEYYIGLPKPLQHRAARLEPIDPDLVVLAERAAQFKGDPEINNLVMTQPKDWYSTRMLNDPDFCELPCSSAHGAATALAVAKLAGILANGGQYKGRTLLSQESIAKLQEPLSHGADLSFSNYDIYGRGTMLLPVVEGKQHYYMYGHSGYGGQNSCADPKYGVGWAYVTNYTDPTAWGATKHRWRPLVEALFACVHRKEGVSCDRKMLTSHEELNEELTRVGSKL